MLHGEKFWLLCQLKANCSRGRRLKRGHFILISGIKHLELSHTLIESLKHARIWRWVCVGVSWHWAGFILAAARLANFVRLMPQLIDTHELGQWQQVSLAKVSWKSCSCAWLGAGRGLSYWGICFQFCSPKEKGETNWVRNLQTWHFVIGNVYVIKGQISNKHSKKHNVVQPMWKSRAVSVCVRAYVCFSALMCVCVRVFVAPQSL